VGWSRSCRFGAADRLNINTIAAARKRTVVLPNQPNRMRSARHGIERDSGFEQFASQEVSIGTRFRAPPTALP